MSEKELEFSNMRNVTKQKNIANAEKLTRIQAPKSNIRQVIVNSRPDGTGFLLLNPARDYIKDISTVKLNNTIRDFNTLIEKFLVEKKISETQDSNKTIIKINNYIMIFSILLSILMFFLLYNEVNDFIDIYIWIPLSLVLLSLLFVLFFLFKGLLTEKKNMDVDFEIKNGLEAMALKENQGYYNKKGYHIDIGEEYVWLAIKKIARKKSDSRKESEDGL